MEKNKKNKKPSNNVGKEKDCCCKNRHSYDKVIVTVAIVTFLILISIIAYLIYKGNHPKLSDGKQVVASIEGKDFTAEELYEQLNKIGGYSVMIDMINNHIIDKEIEDKSDAKTYADSVIAQYELSYKESGSSFKDAVLASGYASIDEFKTVIMNDYLYSEVAKKYIKENVTEKDLKDYYDNHVSDELGVKHILISPDVASNATSDEKKKAEEKALEKAKDLIKQLNNGADFETLAKENSDDTGSAKNGGVINNVVKDKYVTEFWNASYKLELNKYTKEPVKTQYGYHIIYKVSHTEKKSFEDMKDSLYDSVVDSKIEEDSNLKDKSWIEIRKKYNLEIIDTTIQRKYDSVIKELTKTK